MTDLFAAAAEAQLRAQAPLAARLRPRTIDDVVGQDQLVGVGKPLRRLVEQDRLTSAIFWGPPGTGKTTLALAIAGTTKRAFEQLSAVTAGVKDVREVIERARQRLGEHGRGTILFLDEIHRFSKAQQDALLPAVEDGTLTLIGATTENPFFEVNPPLRSRSTLFRLEPLDRPAIEALIERGLEAEGTTASPEAVEHLADRAGGDGRQVLTSLEVASALATPGPITLEHVTAALGTSALRYGRDDHYDVVSAFIKSLRGSDPQATIHYLARMLEAGEDAKFIARRMIIFASEDVGMADPQALVVAVAAAHALEHVGLPEAQLNLSQAAIHLATAPKSNRAALAIWNAREDVRNGAVGEVPAHLRDAHYQGARSLGHGTGYEYPHDHPDGWVDQQYLPAEQSEKRYYEPSEHGAEAEVATRMSRRSRSAGSGQDRTRSIES
ncbi:MAG: putative ATPase [Ilumatobacteraceae bacterium]|nr:putative ATPase [Ilumatobacteraceae bacterium]